MTKRHILAKCHDLVSPHHRLECFEFHIKNENIKLQPITNLESCTNPAKSLQGLATVKLPTMSFVPAKEGAGLQIINPPLVLVWLTEEKKKCTTGSKMYKRRRWTPVKMMIHTQTPESWVDLNAGTETYIF
uniref:Uncharacterized protein n=1 Tax=Anguilla anguilla TaxID=7936 RepID=A0A0E9XSS2_ANGAN